MKQIPVEERFWSKVDKNGPNGCWIWTGQIGTTGYGVIRTGSAKYGTRTTSKAHRVSWRLAYGPITPRECVLHRCDNPLCVNPEHLFLGDRADNNRDRADKGRSLVGENAPWSKLTEAQVREIRELAYAGDLSQKVIAKMYGITQSHVSDLLLRKKWGHVA